MDLKRIFGITLLIGYIGLTYFLMGILFVFEKPPDLPNWAIALIGAMFGGYSTQVNTIIDYTFGGLKGRMDDSRERQEDREERYDERREDREERKEERREDRDERKGLN